jgi:hypothetical protein
MFAMPKLQYRLDWHRHAAVYAVATGVLSAALIGCGASSAPTTQPGSLTEQQNAALRDPFNYGTDLQQNDMRVSGNGEYDAKKMNRDLHDVFDP